MFGAALESSYHMGLAEARTLAHFVHKVVGTMALAKCLDRKTAVVGSCRWV
jgi:hypothetical protein